MSDGDSDPTTDAAGTTDHGYSDHGYSDRDGETIDDTDGETIDRPDGDSSHLDDVPDGCGCTEVWEYLSRQRERRP